MWLWIDYYGLIMVPNLWAKANQKKRVQYQSWPQPRVDCSWNPFGSPYDAISHPHTIVAVALGSLVYGWLRENVQATMAPKSEQQGDHVSGYTTNPSESFQSCSFFVWISFLTDSRWINCGFCWSYSKRLWWTCYFHPSKRFYGFVACWSFSL